MSDSEEERSKRRRERLVELLQPKDGEQYPAVAKRLKVARDLFHAEIAHQATGALNQELARRPQASREERQTMARWLGAELRTYGIAIECPRTHEPGMLHIDSHGRFQIELIEQSAKRQRTLTSKTLPTLAFRAHPNRREPLVEYWSRVKPRQSDGRSP